MKAVILGGGGLTGQTTVRDLATGGVFDSVVVADVDPDLAKAAAKAAGPRATATTLDVRNKAATVKLLKGADVCVNAVQYGFNIAVMEATLEAHVPYLDFGGLFHMTRKQLDMDATFRRAKLLAIPGLGQVPGVSNVLAYQACEDLDKVESVVIRDGWKDFTVGGPELNFTWSPSTFLDEMVLSAQVFEKGAYKEYPPMSGGEEFDFSPPVGRTKVYRTLHSEPATLPSSLKAKGIAHCEWKEGGPGIDTLRTMALLGLASTDPVDVKGQKVMPKEFTLSLVKQRKLLGFPEGITINDWEIMDIEIHGTKGGKSIVRHAIGRFPPRPDWHLSSTEYGVGAVGAVGAEMIVQGTVTATGVVPPELCIPAAPFRAALAKRGLETTINPPEGPLPPRKTF